MRITPLRLGGCYALELDRKLDERGFFARSFCTEELRALGIEMSIAQANWSSNERKGTLRGMHFQAAPHGEQKIVTCVRGAIWDAFVDIRRESPTYGRWDSIELDEQSLTALYLPEGIAHGFQTLTDQTLVQYWMGASYEPTAARGLRFDDPAIGIAWPLPPVAVSSRDHEWPLLSELT